MGETDEETGTMKILDTDIFIDFFRGVKEAAVFLTKHGGDIAFCALTETELLSGQVCNDLREREKVFHLLSQFEKVPVDNPLVQVAGDLRRKYGISIPDALIAATAVVTGAVLVSRNAKDFEKVREIRTMKPY